MPLHINIQDLLEGRFVESERIEYKKGWNPGAIYRSICAFANDIDDIGGGYIIIGVEEENGRPLLPVHGVNEDQIDAIQKEMLGFNNLINPVYHPKVSIEQVGDKKIIVIWVLSGPNRPYEVPDEIKAREKKYNYYVRIMANSIKANKERREELISMSNRVPFDDRPNMAASINDISFTLLKEHLRQTNSRLLEWVDDHSKSEILSQMELLYGPPELIHPRNIALMLFSDRPESFFPYTRVEIVIFSNAADDSEFYESPEITGPIPQQIRQALLYLKTTVLKEKVQKIQDQPESNRIWNYPYQALEEVIANALYHRDYQTREPVEIRVYPDRMVILNYGGPDRSIKDSAFQTGSILPRRYRNRRLGDFLKELDLTEGKATGIPMIRKSLKQNGSPEPIFDTDSERSYFQVTLKSHPDFIIPGGNVGRSNEGVNEGVSEGVNDGENHALYADEVAKLIYNREIEKVIEGVIEGSIEGINTRIKPKLVKVLKSIIINENKRLPEYVKMTRLNAKSIERYIKILREGGLINFTRGGKKMDGYYITNKGKEKLSHFAIQN